MIKIRAQNQPWYRGISILISDEQEHKDCYAIGKIEFVRLEEGELANPTFELKIEAAQQLMDELWQCGIRPTNEVGSVGQLQATEKHLEDMRKLVFSK